MKCKLLHIWGSTFPKAASATDLSPNDIPATCSVFNEMRRVDCSHANVIAQRIWYGSCSNTLRLENSVKVVLK